MHVPNSVIHTVYTQVTSRCRIQSDTSQFNSRKMYEGMTGPFECIWHRSGLAGSLPKGEFSRH